MAICSFNLRILVRCSGGSSWIWSSVKLNTCIISAACSRKEKVCVYVWVGRYEVNTMLQPIRLPAYWPNCMVGDFVGNCRTSFLEEKVHSCGVVCVGVCTHWEPLCSPTECMSQNTTSLAGPSLTKALKERSRGHGGKNRGFS